MRTKTVLLIFLAMVLGLAACTPNESNGDGAAVSPTETPAEQPTATPPDLTEPVVGDEASVPDELLGTWYWLAYQDMAELNDIAVSDPAQYTLEFLADGAVQIKADCNDATSNVTIDGNIITFAPGPMTLAECEPGSLYDDYLAKLGDVVSYVFDEDGNLVLNLKMDAGNMIFGREAVPD